MRILIYGAGSTGCYLGAQFLNAGLDVSFVCRARIADKLKQQGSLHYSDYTNASGATALPTLYTRLPDLSEISFDVCFVTLKCHHIESALNDLMALADSGCELHFLQNGLNAYRTHPELADRKNCYAGIIPFNVLSLDNDGAMRFHKGTEGALQLQSTPRTKALTAAFKQANTILDLYQDIQPVVYGKLLLNLNNAINALADKPLKEQLEDRGLRRVLASAMREYLAVCKARQQELIISAPIPPSLLPGLLSLPTFIFKRLAKNMLAIDPLARSSMWEDIQSGKTTEIDFLNGMVVSLAKEVGISSPVNERICRLVKRLESGEKIPRSEVLKT